MSKYTVFGGRGFIGSEFVKELKNQGHDVFVPERDDISIYEIELGNVIYCAGYGDCQKDPFNVLNANVILLSTLLQKAKFDKLVYISSTRVYMNQELSNENSNLIVSEDDSRRLFNLTKLTAEELCLKSGRDCLIIRPSNVFGAAFDSNLFLPSLCRDAISKNEINLYVSPDYSKDYIAVSDLVYATLKLVEIEILSSNIVNIASGFNVTANDIVLLIKNLTKCKVNWVRSNHSKEEFAPIDISVLKNLIDFQPIDVKNSISNMISDFSVYINN